jgi:AAA domain
MTDLGSDSPETTGSEFDPGTQLAEWANSKDEWTRRIVRLVLASGRPPSKSDTDRVYQLFLEEKRIEPRTLPPEEVIQSASTVAEREDSLVLTELSNVTGVNAIRSGSTILFNRGLTILFGENATGKTGYARILKIMANSRTAEDILSDINDPKAPTSPSAHIKYKLGSAELSKSWHGERGEAPFTRMAIFDTLVVNYHVDEDAVYVYTPASLALFKHVTQGLQGVQRLVGDEIRRLSSSSNSLLSRFNRGSAVYPLIETLGAATDLSELRRLAEVGDQAQDELKNLQMAVAALKANTLPQEIATQQRRERVFAQALGWATILKGIRLSDYNTAISTLANERSDYAKFREILFAAANLPAEPDETWEAFIGAGRRYKEHLEGLEVHDESKCLYCRQLLDAGATDLLGKYQEYLEDRIAKSIAAEEERLVGMTQELFAAPLAQVDLYLSEQDESDTAPDLMALRTVCQLGQRLLLAFRNRSSVDPADVEAVGTACGALQGVYEALRSKLKELRAQATNRAEALAEKEAELLEFEARVELSKVFPDVVTRVEALKRASTLSTLSAKIPAILRQLTELSKTASDELINQNFEQLFKDECEALRAPILRLEFVGREGSAQRRKVLSGKHRPSKVLSEGEQKVLALADFLAEARLTGITAPIIFDDPVNSLDHRRIDEVADRIASLAQTEQVIVFTHDILLATSLLARFEKSKLCTYYQVADEDGAVGVVTRATGPRWDTLSNLKARVNETIQAANSQHGETRAALVRQGYAFIRAWCEVFVERELLQEVTMRYQPNVKMTALSKMKPSALPAAIKTVLKVFEDACRFIDAHSQPLATQGLTPTVASLEKDWATLQQCQKEYNAAS